MNKLIASILLLLSFNSADLFANAQNSSADTKQASELAEISTEAPIDLSKQAIEQLREIQESLKDKQKERTALLREISKATEDRKDALQLDLEQINAEIELLEKTFEQISIGGIDLSVFGVEDKEFDWREELVEVVKPLIENVKSLTEKPRKIENLKRVIDDKQAALDATEEALTSINTLIEKAESNQVKQKLNNIQTDWESRKDDLEREIQLAAYQLDSLEGKGTPWLEVISNNAKQFVSGRGLTLVLIIVAGLAVWWFMKGLLWLIRRRKAKDNSRQVKTHYRLAAYGYRLLTAILIAVAVMMVLYFRQDLLLLAIMVVLFIGFALALKNFLPRYIAEGRILLNIGGIRERERVFYNGIPWEVTSLNVHSLFTNPEIRGGLRIPISHMHEMLSRPNTDDLWFPSSEGDWILGDDGNPEQVIKQTVELVQLRDLNAISHTMPTADYYARGFPNISRADVFRIAVSFGIDYQTQPIDPQTIEVAFTKGIRQAFESADFAEHVQDVSVDFDSAGDSSLNYLMLTKFDSAAAKYYNQIKRRISRACVQVCNEHDWGIPFPQLTIHAPELVDQVGSSSNNE